ncbi:MAG: glycosyltransferase N-terminal domain-containing protein [Rhodobacter sp.]|nr:glycosyltransferase N-terminal domain-containing protein [Rhodobacter sp.]
MGLYRAILTLVAPVVLLVLAIRVLRGVETRADLRQRLGHQAEARPDAIWLHGASNGELTSARPLVDALRAAFPARPLVITANTTTGRALAAAWRLDDTAARLAPVDTRAALRRFRAAWRPAVQIVLENELWPNRLATASEPVLVVGARMSAKSHRAWSRVPGLARQLLGGVRRLTAQDATSADRFLALGLPPDRLGPTATLKSAVSLADPDPDELARLKPVFHRPDTLLAASTHDGEEAIVLEGFLRARTSRPALKLILAPRHPVRGAEIARLLARTGLPWAQRSAGPAPGPDTVIYLADTLGEMPLWYALAGVTFVGGSLVAKGGHTPFEPAQARSAILHGPDTANFAESYATLASVDAATPVADADALATALVALADPQAQEAQARRAAETLTPGPDNPAIRDLIDTLEELLDQPVSR